MIINTRKGDGGRKMVRVNQPVEDNNSGWNHAIGHYLDLGPYQGTDGVFYNVTLPQADIERIIQAWADGAAKRAELDEELRR
jgi:hypothetical protein